jgi:hypothetical protein
VRCPAPAVGGEAEDGGCSMFKRRGGRGPAGTAAGVSGVVYVPRAPSGIDLVSGGFGVAVCWFLWGGVYLMAKLCSVTRSRRVSELPDLVDCAGQILHAY